MNAADWEALASAELFTPRDRVMIRALADDPGFRDYAYVLTDNMVLDDEDSLYLLALGIIGYRHGWDIYPEEAIPRIKGLHRYYQVRNGAAAPWLKERLLKLEEAGIPVMVSGGTAMRAYYAAGIPRMMYGYDITVPSSDHDRAADLLRDSVRNSDQSEAKDRTINGLTFIHLYKGVQYARFFSEKEFWERSKSVEWLDHEIRVPSPEDMLLHLLCFPYGPYVLAEGNSERARRLAECGRLLGFDPDFVLLADISDRAGLKEVCRFYLRALHDIIPVKASKTTIDTAFPYDEKYLSYIKAFGGLCRTVRQEKESPGFFDILSLRLAKRKLLKFLRNRSEQKGR